MHIIEIRKMLRFFFLFLLTVYVCIPDQFSDEAHNCMMCFPQNLSVMLLPQGENFGVRPKNKNRLRMFPAERDEG